MRVLSISTGADCAGIGYSLTRTFRDHPTITVRSAAGRDTFLRYPHDLPWSEAHSEYQAADVVHVHQSAKPLRLFGPKPFVMHHHGTRYRNNAELFNTYVADHGAAAVVSTLDLLDYGDNLTWSPHPVDIGALNKHRQPTGDRLRIGHAPTSRSIKDTDAFLAACARLDVEPVLIERKTWAECLRIKGTCDVLYDQVRLGYGVNAIEAWAMGIPVIAGAHPATMRRYRDTFGSIPFYDAGGPRGIADAIRALMDDATREEWAVRGRNHAHRWHDGRETRERLGRIWQQARG